MTDLIKSDYEKSLPPAVRGAYESLEALQQLGVMYGNSETLPDHYYDIVRDDKGKMISKAPNVGRVTSTLITAWNLRVHPDRAFQGVISVKGNKMYKGDFVRSLIFERARHILADFKEWTEGTVEGGDFVAFVQGRRTDLEGSALVTKRFGVVEAKRMGCWVNFDEAKAAQEKAERLKKEKGWNHEETKTAEKYAYKLTSDAWYKIPERMCGYRALGYWARDVFADIMEGAHIYEETIGGEPEIVDVQAEVISATGAIFTPPLKKDSVNASVEEALSKDEPVSEEKSTTHENTIQEAYEALSDETPRAAADLTNIKTLLVKSGKKADEIQSVLQDLGMDDYTVKTWLPNAPKEKIGEVLRKLGLIPENIEDAD